MQATDISLASYLHIMNNIENTLTYLLTPISNSYWIQLEKAMNDIGLHSGQVFVLISLLKQDGQSQIEISKNLNLAAPTINKMVKNLVESGFVTSKRDKIDTRLVKIFLTEKGYSYEDLIEKKWNELEFHTLLNFTETEKLILFQLFAKLKENLQNSIKTI